MAEYKDLLKLKVVYDDDTGMFRVGEIGGVFINLNEFLLENGKEGRDELLLTLSMIQAKVVRNFEEIRFEENRLLNRGLDQI